MKILFLSDNFPPETNAAATRVFERAVYWVRWGHSVTVITSTPNFPEGKPYDGWENCWCQIKMVEGIRVVRVKTYMTANTKIVKRILDFLSFMIMGLIVGLFEKKPDVVVATSPQFFSAVAGWALGTIRRVPFVFELADIWPASIIAVGAMKENFFLRQTEKLELFLYRQSACVVALTHAFKRNLIDRGIDAQKIAVVRNGVDLTLYAPRIRDAEFESLWNLKGKFVVGYVGTHGMAHGLQNVLDAAEQLQDVLDFRFLLVGNGAECESLKTRAVVRRLSNVVFGNRQPKEMIPRIWSVCNVALVHLRDAPLFAQVIPSKIFEGMAMGLPILIVAPKGEASEILENSGAGFWIPPQDPNSLTSACRKLMKDSRLCQNLATRSYKAAKLYTREAQAQQMLHTLEMAACGNGSLVGCC